MRPFPSKYGENGESSPLSVDSPSESAMMEESSILSSPPRSAARRQINLFFDGDDNEAEAPPSTFRTRAIKTTPRTRNLFPPEDEREEEPKTPMARRGALLPQEKATPGGLFACLSMDDEDSSVVGSSRKRVSAETKPPAGSWASPRISPNSFLTMDGRFVHSKNPFSSPMMTDESIIYATESTAAPQMPDTMYKRTGIMPKLRRWQEDDDPQNSLSHIAEEEQDDSGVVNNLPQILPRHKPFAPQTSFCFYGGSSTSSVSSFSSSNYGDMNTDTASCGSLQKVRRINLHDDVVSASGHELRARHLPPHIQTNFYGGHGETAAEDVSPTDVSNFPFGPPTPAREGRHPTCNYGMNSAGRQKPTPPTPVAERRRAAALAARTHNPGSALNGRSPVPGTQEKSRFYGDFDLMSELGNGCFGTVYKVLSRLDGCMYAIKAAKRQARGQSDRDRMLKEVYALAALSDQADPATFHIVRYHQAWMEEDRLYIQTELCQGNLADEVTRGKLCILRSYKLLREVCLALEFLHRNNMVHLDIKPDNIFIKNDQFKLGDFGFVAKISNHEEVEEGDSRYMSKELLAGDHTDLTKSDIFSLGATVYEICLHEPLPSHGQQWQDIRAGQLNLTQLRPNCDADMVTIITQMMHPDYRNRPSASHLLKKNQLLSNEQKALMAERAKVAALQLMSPPPLPGRRGLTRASTWNGASMNI